MVNFIQLVGDSLHLLSFVIIIYKIFKDKSCKGVSAKTFEIYLVVFCTRYLDLFMYFISFYNTFMKILFIGASVLILFLMHCKDPFKSTYKRKEEDVFPHYYLIIFAVIMTLLVHKDFTLWGLTWSFSLWLESVAVFPQITILAKKDGVFNYTAHYLATLGLYRFFYILLWIYRYVKQGRVLWVSVFSGILQVLLYADFFYLYIKNAKKLWASSDLPIVSKKPTNKEKENIF
jgi:ER lumen protein retaining receptor